MQPVWVSIGIGMLSMVFAAGVAWGVVTIRIKQVERDQADLKTSNTSIKAAIDALPQAIREEFDKAIKRINHLVFEDSGTSRYMPRPECIRNHDECRADLLARIEKVEKKVEGP